MYCKSRTNGVGLWDPRVGNMTYPEPYRNPLRRLYPGMSKSMDGLGQISDMNAVATYNINSAQNNNWGISQFGRSIGITSPGHPTIGALAYAFQKKYGLTADGKIGPRTLEKMFSQKRSMANLNHTPTSSDVEYIVALIEPRASGFNPPSPDGGGRSGGGRSGGGTTPRRSMSDGDEMNLDVAPPPKDPKDPKKSSIPMPLAIGGGVLIAVGLALFMKNKN